MKNIILGICVIALIILGIFVYLRFINNDTFKEDDLNSDLEKGDLMVIKVSNNGNNIIYRL